MSWFTSYISLIFILLLSGCKKETQQVILSPHTEEKIVCEGYFTEELKKHRFKFSKSQSLNDVAEANEDNVSVLVKTPSGPINYSNIGNGIFESNEPFAGEYGETYTIQFSYLGTVHEVETVMPDSVDVEGIVFDNFFESGSSFSQTPNITVNVNTTAPCYLGYEIQKGRIITFTDTLWETEATPIFLVTELPFGYSYPTLPIPSTDNMKVASGTLLKVKTYIYSQDVGEYLLRLKNYVESELTNSQFYNPPYYYSKGAYGLGYGTLLDSAIHQY